jgi:hypothetical protein
MNSHNYSEISKKLSKNKGKKLNFRKWGNYCSKSWRRSYNYLKYAAVFGLGLGVFLGTANTITRLKKKKLLKIPCWLQITFRKINPEKSRSYFFLFPIYTKRYLNCKSDAIILLLGFSKRQNASALESNSLLKWVEKPDELVANKKGYFPVSLSFLWIMLKRTKN